MEEKIKGEQNPSESNKPNYLKKEDIMFNVDEEGIAIPEKVEVEIYDKALDDALYLSTMQLDSSLTLYDSTKESFKKIAKSINAEIKKQSEIISNLESEGADAKKVKLAKDMLKSLNEKMTKLEFENEIKLKSFQSSIKEAREDMDEFEKQINDTKKIMFIDATPCKVGDAYKYFNKKMYKDENGNWQKPLNEEDNTWIGKLLSSQVATPSMTFEEWDISKPEMRLCIKDKIAELSRYTRPNPKEILIERRRSEKLKNIEGECDN